MNFVISFLNIVEESYQIKFYLFSSQRLIQHYLQKKSLPKTAIKLGSTVFKTKKTKTLKRLMM